MIINVLTLFPGMFDGVFNSSILKRAQESGAVQLGVRNIRDYAADKHKMTDDMPYGGGPGMVMKPEPIAAAFDAITADFPDAPPTRVYLSPEGEPWTQSLADEMAKLPHVVLLCGHYEGIDERVRELYIHREISLGDFVLTGGEIPAMAVVDSIVRLIPGVVGNAESVVHESFCGDGLLDHPHYTRPEEFHGVPVPEVLKSGHHKKIEQWRRLQAIQRTIQRRPDIIDDQLEKLSAEERALLRALTREKQQ